MNTAQLAILGGGAAVLIVIWTATLLRGRGAPQPSTVVLWPPRYFHPEWAPIPTSTEATSKIAVGSAAHNPYLDGEDTNKFAKGIKIGNQGATNPHAYVPGETNESEGSTTGSRPDDATPTSQIPIKRN